MKKIKVRFVSGYLCSGKGTYCKKTGLPVISVSGIVKLLVGSATRAELQDSAHLANIITAHIKERLWLALEIANGVRTDNNEPEVIVDGVRQPEIFQSLIEWLNGLGWLYTLVWIETPKDDCRRRFLAKNDGKENVSFEDAFDRDAKLGLLDLERRWRENHGCIVIQG